MTETTTYSPVDVADLAIKRGVRWGWYHRIRSMADYGWTVKGSINGDREVSPYISVRVASNWPVRGSITCHRQDGKVVYLRHSKSKGFTVEVTA